jgi:glycosyltransferase involved in cell wall biosynthesis
MIRISAIICTFKRPAYLAVALQSLLEQTLARDDYEIVVVDNAVQLETQQVVKSHETGGVNLRYVPEPRVGLSIARNTGLLVAAAPYVAFLDDDARAETQWLQASVSAFEQTVPSPAAVGGPVSLDWHGERPAWVPEQHLPLFTCVDHGATARALDKDEYLVGANLAFDKDELLALGGFDSNLGRQGAVLLSGEESAILAQLREKQLIVYYEPAAHVWHSVDDTRKRRSWLVRRLFWDGASQPLIDLGSQEISRRFTFANACTDVRECARWIGRALVSLVTGKQNHAWESFLGFAQRAGRLRTQLHLLARGRWHPVSNISEQKNSDSITHANELDTGKVV